VAASTTPHVTASSSSGGTDDEHPVNPGLQINTHSKPPASTASPPTTGGVASSLASPSVAHHTPSSGRATAPSTLSTPASSKSKRASVFLAAVNKDAADSVTLIHFSFFSQEFSVLIDCLRGQHAHGPVAGALRTGELDALRRIFQNAGNTEFFIPTN
jgi:hypothetical protein